MDLFFDLKAFLKSLKVHLPSPKYFKAPTIDLTCCCKKDLDIKVKIIFFLFILIETFLRVLTGDFDSHEEDLKVEKLCVPFNNLAPSFMAFILSFFLICQTLFFSKTKDGTLFTI